jgi:hypothetical protein
LSATHIKLWLIFLFLAFLAVPWLMPPEMARARLQSEQASSAEIFGVKTVNDITSTANSAYNALVKSTGIEAFLQAGFVEEKDVREKQFVGGNVNREMSTVTNRYLESMLLQLYGLFYRGFLMLHWMWYVGFFLVAAFVDGLTQRSIKREVLAVNDPIKFAMAFHTLIVIVFTPFAYLLLPAAVTPWFMPIWAVLVAFPLSKAISNAVRTS